MASKPATTFSKLASLPHSLSSLSALLRAEEQDSARVRVSSTRWWLDVFRLRGSTIGRIWSSTLVFTALALAVAIVDEVFSRSLMLSNSTTPLLTVVVGLLLVFRNSSAFNRWNEGRQLFASLYATSRNLARSTWVGVGAPGPHAHAETLAAVGDASVQRGKETALRLIVAFVIATKHHLRREYSLAHDDLNECLPPRFERYLRKKADENDAADEKVNDKTTTDVVDDEAASSSSATTAAARQAPGTPSPHSSPRAGRSPLRTRSPESLLSRDRVDSPLYHLSRAGAGAGGQVNESVGNAADEYARLRREYLRRRHSTSQPPGPRPRVLVHASTSPGDSATATNNNSSRTSDGRPAQRSRAQSLLGATAAVMLGTGATRKPTSSMLARANSAPGGPKKGLHVQQQPQQQQRWRHPFQLGGGGGGGGGDGGGGDGGGGGKSRASSPAAAGAPSLATMPDLEIGAEMPVPQTTAPRREVVRHEHEMDDDNDDDAHHPIVALGPRPTSAAPATDHERTPLLRQRRLSPAGAHSHLATRALSSNDDDNGGEQEETSREGALDPPPSPRRHSVRSLTAREDVLDDYFARPSLPLPVVIAQHLQLYFASCRQKSLIDGLGPAGYNALVQLTHSLIDTFSAIDSLNNIAIPAVYGIHLKQCVTVFLATLPFTLKSMGWKLVPTVTVVAFTLLGIEGIASELEQPFGLDDSDLPLDLICAELRNEVEHIISTMPAAPADWDTFMDEAF